MTREYDDSSTGDTEVTNVYRDLASERTPPHLDRAVLKEAAAAAASGRKRGSAWLLPLAFAATVGLSLAVLLEITSAPDLDGAESGALVQPAGFADETPAPPIAEEQERRPAPLAGGGTTAPTQMEQQRPELPTAKPSVSPSISTAPQRQSDMKEAADSFSKAAAESKRSMQADQERVMELRSTVRSNTASVKSGAPGSICSDEARRTATSWWQCIEALREQEDSAEVRDELAAFREAHPDFEAAE